MDVVSLGFRTDLMLLEMQGSSVTDRGDHLVVRTAENPGYRWGNFLLLEKAPGPGEVERWVDVFRREFPRAGHVAIGVDGVDGELGTPDEWRAAGLSVERGTVLTAGALREPRRGISLDVEIRELDGDPDWAAALELRLAVGADLGYAGAEYGEFAGRKLDAMRRLRERGLGAWFGAFLGGRMVSGLGIFGDGSGIARYQSVETHPEHRRRGLAGALVHRAGEYARDRLEARTLVIVADPEYTAIRLYRGLGFDGTETQVQLERATPAG
ncbi:GNAT family N-acetyltransferase [Bailinhaonella thermotolerans]|uniref:GNAT family N-acetyltransferase n=1 Tax=Bailinhaonella thermotolerans TaxID=1070861 RepID=A0A3A4AUN0_9ACTN|nr:GNAT family N-acetyltransferase [Bailinhaonella thermotolerans]RJL31995.1 GNAT family N-acetyltransferase [Bailinhaonella thermotolerans]